MLESHFNKVTGIHACNFIKKRLQHMCFPMKFAKFLRTPILTQFREGFIGAAHGGGSKKSPLSKICHTYLTMMKLGTVIPYLKKIQKTYKSSGASLESCRYKYFSPKINNFCYINKYRYRSHFNA